MDQTTEAVVSEQPNQSVADVTVSDQSPSQEFKTLIPDEYKNEKSLQNFNSMNDFVKSYLHSQRLVGADKIPVPNKHATKEDWEAVYSRLGRPEKPDGYKYNLPKDARVDEQSLKAFSEKAHELNLLPHQAEGIMEYYNQLAVTAEQDSEFKIETARAEAEKSLRSEFGPSYNNRISAAKNLALNTLGSEFLNNTILQDGSKLGDNPLLVKAFASLAEKLSEDSIVKGDTPSSMTTKQIDEQISKLTQKGSAYWDKNHINHARAVSEVQELYQLKNNG